MYSSFDTEAFYSKDYSVSDLGPWGYVHDPRFDCYQISIASDTGFEWVGHPKDCPWEKLRGEIFLTPNAGFDQAVLKRLIELGLAPADAYPAVWHCTANMGVYLGYPRSLAGFVEQSFGVKLDKTIRDKDIKGKKWSEFGEELQKKVLVYGLNDARWPLKLWQKHSADWPEHERILSELTYRMGEQGIFIDRDGLEADIKTLERVKFEAEQKIPWAGEFPILSARALGMECRKSGIEPPASLAMASEECAAWEDRYGPQFPFVAAARDWRRSNMLLEKFKTARDRIMPNGRMHYSMLYFGAHTGRWSGAGGWNVQNQPRLPFYFDENWSLTETVTERKVEMRSKLRAAPGMKFVIADYAQIEARVLPWLAGDRMTMQLIRAGLGVYEAHSKLSMGWTGGPLKKENPALYQLAKARVLALGFGAGWLKFITMARMYVGDEVFAQVFGKEVTEENVRDFITYLTKTDKKGTTLRQWPKLTADEQRIWVNAWLQVSDFRKNNPKIVAVWNDLDRKLKQSSGGTYQIDLPSGRTLNYFNVSVTSGQTTVHTTRGGRVAYTYGGKLAENATQAAARDVIAEALVRLHKAGINVVLHVHDEIVCEVPQDFDPKIILNLMVQSPTWAKTLPIGAEYEESAVYRK